MDKEKRQQIQEHDIPRQKQPGKFLTKVAESRGEKNDQLFKLIKKEQI